jgi:hypothetical protein
MTTRPVFVCSNRHISAATAAYLEAEAGNYPFAGGATDYGWFFYTSPHNSEKMPPDLRGVHDRALAAGAPYLLLDQDADEVEGLPTYEW